MYDTFSTDYDRFVHWSGRLTYELPFIKQQLGAISIAGQPCQVFDAACGTGVHAIALAQAGFAVAGADLSAGMIERARENAREAGVAVDLRVAGFGQLAQTFQDPFDALLCLGNSLPHLLSLAQLADALQDFAACLRPGGLVLIQNRNFDAVLLEQERWMEPQSHREGDREWVFLRFYDYNPDGLITFNIVNLTRQGSTGWQQSITSTRIYPMRHAEVKDALIAGGFDDVQAFGNMSGNSFIAEKSGNLVITARRR